MHAYTPLWWQCGSARLCANARPLAFSACRSAFSNQPPWSWLGDVVPRSRLNPKRFSQAAALTCSKLASTRASYHYHILLRRRQYASLTTHTTRLKHSKCARLTAASSLPHPVGPIPLNLQETPLLPSFPHGTAFSIRMQRCQGSAFARRVR